MLDLENEQDHALIKLESRAYHMGSRDVFWYTKDFEDLIDLAGFDDPIVKVTKYCTGLDLAINLTITGSGGSARGTVRVVGISPQGRGWWSCLESIAVFVITFIAMVDFVCLVLSVPLTLVHRRLSLDTAYTGS
ncbi:hypothetical protein DFH06DRAFT_1345798 [Mycena polygramma]|nr:hypothetical protein DFH06DRAFT_1345798 [Mycena polygramma]